MVPMTCFCMFFFKFSQCNCSSSKSSIYIQCLCVSLVISIQFCLMVKIKWMHQWRTHTSNVSGPPKIVRWMCSQLLNCNAEILKNNVKIALETITLPHSKKHSRKLNEMKHFFVRRPNQMNLFHWNRISAMGYNFCTGFSIFYAYNWNTKWIYLCWCLFEVSADFICLLLSELCRGKWCDQNLFYLLYSLFGYDVPLDAVDIPFLRFLRLFCQNLHWNSINIFPI